MWTPAVGCCVAWQVSCVQDALSQHDVKGSGGDVQQEGQLKKGPAALMPLQQQLPQLQYQAASTFWQHQLHSHESAAGQLPL